MPRELPPGVLDELIAFTDRSDLLVDHIDVRSLGGNRKQVRLPSGWRITYEVSNKVSVDGAVVTHRIDLLSWTRLQAVG